MSKKILVVEDEKSWQALLVEICKDVGVICEVAGTLDEARKLLELRSYDLVFLDMRLDACNYTTVDGIVLLEWMKVSGFNTKVVVLSGFASLDSMTTAFVVYADLVIDWLDKMHLSIDSIKKLIIENFRSKE